MDTANPSPKRTKLAPQVDDTKVEPPKLENRPLERNIFCDTFRRLLASGLVLAGNLCQQKCLHCDYFRENMTAGKYEWVARADFNPGYEHLKDPHDPEKLQAFWDSLSYGPYQNYFPFFDLPPELQHYLLRFMLVCDEPVTNPHLQYKPWSRSRMAISQSGFIRYTWSKYFRPNIREVRAFHEEGMKMLYGYNRFRITRLVAQSGNQWGSFCILRNDSNHDQDHLNDWLSAKHRVLIGQERHIVRRSTLIRNLIIEDSDVDSDFYAKRGIARLVAKESPVDKHRLMLWILGKMARRGGTIRNLTVTVDEGDPGVAALAEVEQDSCWYLDQAKQLEWVVKTCNDLSPLLDRKWTIATRKQFCSKLNVENIHIRGTDIFGEGMTDFDVGRHKCVPTGQVAKAVQRLLFGLSRGVLFHNEPNVSFLGRFVQRRLKDDGSWVSDEELEEWMEGSKAKEVLRDTDPIGALKASHDLWSFI